MSKTFLEDLLTNAPTDIRTLSKKLDLSKVQSWNDLAPFFVFFAKLVNWKGGGTKDVGAYISKMTSLIKDFSSVKGIWLKSEAEQAGLKELEKSLKAYEIFKKEVHKRLSEKDYKAITDKIRRWEQTNAGN